MSLLRFGVIGTAWIGTDALLDPASRNPRVEVRAVASRDAERARKYADSNGIPNAHGSYAELLADPDIDVVFNALPNALHGEWTVAALRAGKNVLCEKPFTANAAEAQEVAEIARRSGLVVMEAFHYRHHPLAARLLEIIRSGRLGSLQSVEASFSWDATDDPANIRWSWPLAGGSVMDVGCYTVHIVRTLAGEEPSVKAASASLSSPNVDAEFEASLLFPSGATGRVHSSMRGPFKTWAHVTGTEGELSVSNPVHPQLGAEIEMICGGERTVEKTSSTPSYDFQLEAFTAAVLDGGSVLTGLADAVSNMMVIDEMYLAAGLPVRQPAEPSA
jgi:predicted dehydrogenase